MSVIDGHALVCESGWIEKLPTFLHEVFLGLSAFVPFDPGLRPHLLPSSIVFVNLELVDLAMCAVNFFGLAAHLEILDRFLEKCRESWLGSELTLIGRAALRDVVVSCFMLPIADLSRAILSLCNRHAAPDMIPLDYTGLLWLRHFNQSIVLRRRLLLLGHAIFGLESVLAVHHAQDHLLMPRLPPLLDIHVPGVSLSLGQHLIGRVPRVHAVLVDVKGRRGDLLVGHILVRLTRVHHIQALDVWGRYRAIREAGKIHKAVGLRLRLLVQAQHWMGADRRPVALSLFVASIFAAVCSNVTAVLFGRRQYLPFALGQAHGDIIEVL